MKRLFLILCAAVVLLLSVFAIQNKFLFGLPFIHRGSELSDVDRDMGNAEYHGDLGATNNVYFVRIGSLIVATVNVNINTDGIYASDGKTGTITHPVNLIKWTTLACFDRKEAVKLSLPHPDIEPNWSKP